MNAVQKHNRHWPPSLLWHLYDVWHGCGSTAALVLHELKLKLYSWIDCEICDIVNGIKEYGHYLAAAETRSYFDVIGSEASICEANFLNLYCPSDDRIIEILLCVIYVCVSVCMQAHTQTHGEPWL